MRFPNLELVVEFFTVNNAGSDGSMDGSNWGVSHIMEISFMNWGGRAGHTTLQY